MYNSNSNMLSKGTTLQHRKYVVDRYIASGGSSNVYIVKEASSLHAFAMRELFINGFNWREEDSCRVQCSLEDENTFNRIRIDYKRSTLHIMKLSQNSLSLIKIHDLFEENNTVYYIMDYFERGTLRDRLNNTNSTFPEEDGMFVFNRILKALKDIHHEGILHLNIKPGSILEDNQGNVFLSNFNVDFSKGQESTTSAQIAYTEGYAPMEQKDNYKNAFGPWTDFYALGATLYELLTLNQPPQSSTIINEPDEAFNFSKVSNKDIQQLILWLMTPQRKHRPQSVEQIESFLMSHGLYIPMTDKPVGQVRDYDDTSFLPVGSLLKNGTYCVEKYLSSGGFGKTYVVSEVSKSGHVFAMKEFFMKGINLRKGTEVSVSTPDNKSSFDSQKRKFQKEAQRLKAIHHPNIVGVYDSFEDNGTCYYIMDYIDGESLAQKLEKDMKPLSVNEVINILYELLDALDEVHKEDITHLDLKPGNIMQDKQGCAYLIDFGASKQWTSEENHTLSTSTAMPYTEGYAPMEQVERELKNVGPWTDLYALGATIYKLLTLNQPPKSTTIFNEPDDAFDFSKVSNKDVQELIIWLMTPQRKRRPQSVEEVRDYLKEHHLTIQPPNKVNCQEDAQREDVNTKVNTYILQDNQKEVFYNLQKTNLSTSQNRGQFLLNLLRNLGIEVESIKSSSTYDNASINYELTLTQSKYVSAVCNEFGDIRPILTRLGYIITKGIINDRVIGLKINTSEIESALHQNDNAEKKNRNNVQHTSEETKIKTKNDASEATTYDQANNQKQKRSSNEATTYSQSIVSAVKKEDTKNSQSYNIRSQATQKTYVEVRSEPKGASVSINGKWVGTTPNIFEVAPGLHEIKVKDSSWNVFSKSIGVAKGETFQIYAQLTQEAYINVKSDPSGAAIYIDGKWRGVTPNKIKTTRGDHDVKLSKEPNWYPYIQFVNVAAGQTVDVYATLEQIKTNNHNKTDWRKNVSEGKIIGNNGVNSKSTETVTSNEDKWRIKLFVGIMVLLLLLFLISLLSQ